MKIVIDIPEKLYNDLLCTPTECIPIMGEFIADGKPLSEVFGKIKVEMDDIPRRIFMSITEYNAEIYKILDSHIGKEDNNGTR